MEERIKALEDFSQISTALAIQVESSQRRMSARQARMEERQRQMVEQLGQMEERQRQIEEDQQLADESQRRTAELVQQLVQAAAIIQAEIIRIDETRP